MTQGTFAEEADQAYDHAKKAAADVVDGVTGSGRAASGAAADAATAARGQARETYDSAAGSVGAAGDAASDQVCCQLAT